MSVEVGDIYHRVAFGDHWLITAVKHYKNNVYQFIIYNLEADTYSTYTSPFGDNLSKDAFNRVA
jgi:hypothetical protein